MIVTMLGPDARPYQGPDDQRDFRHGCRCIIERDGMILFSCMSNRNQYLLPGGGLEGNESFEACVTREALEEQGVKIGSIHWFGSVEDCYADKCYRNEYCSAVIEEEGFPTSLVPGGTFKIPVLVHESCISGA